MRNRLLLVLVGVVALVLLVHDVPLARHLDRVERDRLVTKLERDAFILAGRAEEGLEGGDVGADPALHALVARYAVDEGVRVVIVDSDGSGVVSSDPGDLDEDFTNRPEIESALGGVPTTGQRFSDTLGEDLFYVAVPVVSGDDVRGVVRISAPERVVSDRTWGRVRGLFVVAGISLAIAVAVAWLVSVSVSRPLRRLQGATQSFAAGDLDTRAVEGEGPREVRDLSTAFNVMAARQQTLLEAQRTFVGTASHELRTPLTALRLRLEQLALDPDLNDRSRHHAEAALDETDRLHRMIEGLLALSRAEGAAVAPVDVDLAAIARDRARHWEPLAAERGVRLALDVPATQRVTAMPGAVEQVIDNLVDNALDVSTASSTLTVSVVPAGEHAELHVIDEGPGLSPDERAAAFGRFWRGPNASPGGTGLGLAIVHQLATASGAAAELRESPAGGVDALVAWRTAERE